MTELCIKALLSYLLGSVMGSLVIRRITGGVDIRNLGSGNAGVIARGGRLFRRRGEGRRRE